MGRCQGVVAMAEWGAGGPKAACSSNRLNAAPNGRVWPASAWSGRAVVEDNYLARPTPVTPTLCRHQAFMAKLIL